MKITFNTNRGYSLGGQVVTAEYDDMTNTALFHDHTRMIAGYISYIPEPTSAIDLQHEIMDAYDKCEYTDSCEARKLTQDHHATHLE